MTVIAGLVCPDGRVMLAGDSAGVSGYDLSIRKDPKVFSRGPLVIGYTTSYRMGQLLRYSLYVPPKQDAMDAHEWASTVLVDSIRSCFKSGGFAQKDHEKETGGQFLVGYQSRLFSIGDDYQVGERVGGYDAVGCGADYALASMYTLKGYSEWGKDALEIAMRCTEHHSIGVRGPFNFVSTEVMK